jgi:hypothetical protein
MVKNSKNHQILDEHTRVEEILIQVEAYGPVPAINCRKMVGSWKQEYGADSVTGFLRFRRETIKAEHITPTGYGYRIPTTKCDYFPRLSGQFLSESSSILETFAKYFFEYA